MEIEETMLMEIGMDSHCHVMTDAHHSTKGIGTQTHVGILTHHLKRLSLLLHRIGIIAHAIKFQTCCLYLTTLSCTLTLNECSNSTDTRTSSDIFQQLFIELRRINNHLNILDSRTIIQGYEVYCLRTTMRTHPAFHTDLFSEISTFQYVNDLCSLHLLIYLFTLLPLLVSSHS